MALTKKTVGFGLSALAAITAIAYFTTRSNGAQNSGGAPPGFGAAPVVVATAGYDEFVDAAEAVGTARSNESVELAAKVTETVRRVRFTDGQIVRKGDVLIELTRQEESAMLDETLARLEEARKDYRRAGELDEKDMIAKSDLQNRNAEFLAAQARVNAVQARLADRLIRAPFDGVVGLRNVSPGELMSPGRLVATLDDISVIKLDAPVPEIYIPVVKPGLEIVAHTAAYPDHVFRGTVTGVDTRVDPITRSVVTRAEIPNPDALLRPGMMLRVDLVRERRHALMIPESAIVQGKDRPFVFAIGADNKAEQRPVTIRGRRPGQVEVVEGLAEGDAVVIEGGMKVRPGGDVKVVRRINGVTGETIPPAENVAADTAAPGVAKD
jgi:membrane fusion protein (multidrug efflux system)